MSEQEVLQTRANGVMGLAHTAKPKTDAIVANREWHSSKPPSSRRGGRMKTLFRVSFIMLLSFTLIIVSVRALARTSITPSDPLFSHADDLIGQPVIATEAYRFSCSSLGDDLNNSRCLIEPATGAFSEIVVVSSGGTTLQIAYTMRNDTTQIGHLLWLWGEPEVQIQKRSIYLSWRSQHIIAVAHSGTGLLSVTLPVHKVYFQCGNACLDWSETSRL